MPKKPTDLICGEPAFLQGEERKAYAELSRQVSGAVKPKDAMEKIWIRDVVDLTRDVIEYRAVRAALHVALVEWSDDDNPDLCFRTIVRNMEYVERLTAAAEHRRNEAYRQIERRREVFARRLRENIEQVESDMSEIEIDIQSEIEGEVQSEIEAEIEPEIEPEVPQITDQSETGDVEEGQA